MAKRKKQHDPSKVLISHLVLRAAKIEAAKRITHICPVYRFKTAKEPELIGTGFFLAIAHRKFIVSAGHVFGPTGEGRQILYIPSHSTGNLTELVGKFVRSKPDGDASTGDSNDVGIVLLDDGLAEQIHTDSFVNIDSVDVDDIGDRSRPYMAMGFPWRVSPKVCRRSRMVEATPCIYASELLSDEQLLKLGLSPQSHFLLRYAKRHSRTEHSQDLTAPDPHGMSGGPLWRMDPSNAHGKTSQLVGIIIEWHRRQGGMLAIRMPVALAGISQLCPDIAHLIPRTQTLDIKITSPPLVS